MSRALSNQLCACGCGRFTYLAKWDERKRGHVKGHPLAYLHGHGGSKLRGRRFGGDRAYRNAVLFGETVSIHRRRAEAALGKPLPKGAVVHHADGSKHEDAPLVICQDETYHKLLHHRMRVKAAGGDPNTDLVCAVCKRAKPMNAFGRNKAQPRGYSHYCRECASDYQRTNRGAA